LFEAESGLIAKCIVMLIVLSALNRPAAAQVAAGYVGAAEAADNGQQVYLVGGWLTRARTGWAPTANVFAYRIELASGSEMDGIWAVNPAVGMRRQLSNGSVQGTVGYTWQSATGDIPGAARRVGSGVTNALQADYWGTGANPGQLIVSHSWGGAGYTWSRARAGHRVAQSEAGAIVLGAELGWQGNRVYKAVDVGGVLEWRRHPLGLVATAGYRSVQEGATGSAPYMSLAAVIIP
jgi:hypothetical protein